MITINSKRYGNIGEVTAICEFTKLGIPVYLPFGDDERTDLIAEFNGKLNKIQVKTSKKTHDGYVMFNLASSYAHRGQSKRLYTKNDVDYFFCYNIERDKSYLFETPDVPATSILIRYGKTDNGQKNGINFERDFLFDNVIRKILKNDGE